MAGEGVAKNIRQVVPDLLTIEGICKVGLGASIVQAILDSGDLDGDATRGRVMVQDLGIGTAGSNSVLLANGATNGPDIDGETALVDNLRVANSAGKRSQSGNGSDGSCGEPHREEWW